MKEQEERKGEGGEQRIGCVILKKCPRTVCPSRLPWRRPKSYQPGLCASRAGPRKARNARPCPFPSPQCWARPMATISRPGLCRKSGLRRFSKRCWRGPKGEHGPDKHRLTSSITLLFFTIRSSSHRSPIQNHDYRCEYPSPWVPFESWK